MKRSVLHTTDVILSKLMKAKNSLASIIFIPTFVLEKYAIKQVIYDVGS